ncbi:MAG: phosphopantetheine-binding protein, partial [Magnetospirillum sp.]|nr:phosphopantetheine-binding protein [Magnetospirillum sp.]
AALPAPRPATRHRAPPRDAVERRLRDVWATVLDRDAADLGIEDDFQLCGGHSLLWVRLLAEIGRVFARPVATADFIDATTIARQADILRRRDGDDGPVLPDSVVLLRQGNAGRPLFLVHAALGGVDIYDQLARHLPPGPTVLGLPAPGLDGHQAPLSDLRQLAAHHLTTLRQCQPRGPYALGGWSLGGVVAFEIARQLREIGETVDVLALIDSYTSACLRRLEGDDDVQTLDRAFARDVGAVAPDTDPQRQALLRGLYLAHGRALADYRPVPCDAPMTLLRTAQPIVDDETLGWAEWAACGLDIQVVPGTHHSVLKAPEVASLAVILGHVLSLSEVAS